jgi:hypothetical protein
MSTEQTPGKKLKVTPSVEIKKYDSATVNQQISLQAGEALARFEELDEISQRSTRVSLRKAIHILTLTDF